jgi:hypothetical protein
MSLTEVLMFYQPVRDQRYFTSEELYSQIDWTDFRKVVDAFRRRLEGWYVTPAQIIRDHSWHYSFALMALDCLLIDALSQYYYGVTTSSRTTFKDFVKESLPALASLPAPIKCPGAADLKTYADVLYAGFRCGILHEAHVPLYGGMSPLAARLYAFEPTGYTKYHDGTDCPTVQVDPVVLFDELKKVFAVYLSDLVNPDARHDDRRAKFKAKFSSSFGIDVTRSKL